MEILNFHITLKETKAKVHRTSESKAYRYMAAGALSLLVISKILLSLILPVTKTVLRKQSTIGVVTSNQPYQKFCVTTAIGDKGEVHVLRHSKLNKYVGPRLLINRNELKAAFKTTFSQKFTSKYANVFERFFLCFEVLTLGKILVESEIESIFITNSIDRYSRLWHVLRRKYGIRVNYVQHGFFTDFGEVPKVEVDSVHLLREFSRSYVPKFFQNVPDDEIYILPNNKTSDKKWQIADSESIAYACMPTNHKLNVEIIQSLAQAYSEFTVFVYPHPRENIDKYKSLKLKCANIKITRDRHSNIRKLYLRVSSIGYEYYEKEIPVYYLNFEGHKTDYMELSASAIFDSYEEFSKSLDELK